MIPPTDHYGPVDGTFIIAMAEKFGVLPDDIENRMSAYWFHRTATLMEAQSINERRIEREREKKAKLRGRR